MDPTQTSFSQLLSIGTKMVGLGASEIVFDPATVALVDGASVFNFLSHLPGVGHIPSCIRYQCVPVELHR